MSRMRSIVLIVALAAVLGAALCFEAPPVQAAPVAASAAFIGPNIPMAIAFPAQQSRFVSEDELWRQFYHAADHHNGWIAMELLRVIHIRHAHRCCGLPR